jgi:NADH:ubiquinone oxidoreductase subunit
MNLTGTPEAYHPKGSILGNGPRAKSTTDYKAWRPHGS